MGTLDYSKVSRYASGALRRLQRERMRSREETPPLFETEQQAKACLRQAPQNPIKRVSSASMPPN